MERFEAYLYQRLAEGILLFERPNLSDVYVLSMYLDFDDGPHRCKIWLYYNTQSYLERSIALGEDPDEARWYFALWEQDFITALGLSPAECPDLADQCYQRLLAEWLKEQGLYRSDVEIEAMLHGTDPCRYSLWEAKVRTHLLHLLPTIAGQLQESGVLLAKFGRSLPLLVHEWDYDHWTLEATQRANPLGLTTQFEHWLRRAGCGGWE